MYQKGYIYKGLKPVYWCTDCETALAEAEIEYADVKTTSIYVKFRVADGKGKLDEKDTYIVIWTTTPWTLPGNTGITVGEEFEYSVVDTGKEKLVIATELVDKVMQLAKIENYKTIKQLKGKDLEGIQCKHPFLDRNSKVVLGSEDTILVELGTGTGAVAGKIKRRFVTKAVEQLVESGSQFLGVVLNKVDMTVDKYVFYGSYGSYGEYGKKSDQKEGHSRAHRRRKVGWN